SWSRRLLGRGGRRDEAARDELVGDAFALRQRNVVELPEEFDDHLAKAGEVVGGLVVGRHHGAPALTPTPTRPPSSRPRRPRRHRPWARRCRQIELPAQAAGERVDLAPGGGGGEDRLEALLEDLAKIGAIRHHGGVE